MAFERRIGTNLLRSFMLVGMVAGCKCGGGTRNLEAQRAAERPPVAALEGNPGGVTPPPLTPTINNDIFNIGVPFPQISAVAPPPLSPTPSGGGTLGMIQEDFSDAQLAGTLNTSRYWYTFGQFQFVAENNAMHVRGTATDWSGFGADTSNGANGQAFDATGCRYLEFDIRGTLSGRMKVELTDFSGKAFEYWFESVPSDHHMKVRLENVSGQIGKLQWVAGPGITLDLHITNIKFTAEESAAAPTPTPASSVSDADPIMAITAVDGHRTSGRYLQAAQDLANYFLNNQGDPPNATHQTTVNGVAARAAYHVLEDQATHLCNGGATTSETQVTFFNFMTLYGALTGNHEAARDALAYIRLFMMPHDGAESPQLPDSRLGVGGNYPVILHWLIDVSGNAQARTCPDGRTGTGVVGEGETYNMYDPQQNSPPYASMAQNASGQVDLSLRQQGGGHHAASFADATDADQWLAIGAYFAGRYGLGDPTALLMNLRKGLTEGANPPDAAHYPDAMRFAIYWGEDNAPDLAFRGTVNTLYAGYQAPDAWEIMGRHSGAQNIVKFLADAQKEFKQRYHQNGPFMPVFKDGAWGWEGEDPNTHWMGFQYRAFAHLANYYYLTGDANARQVLNSFITWFRSNRQVSGDQIQIPLEIENGSSNTGTVRRTGYGPHEYALMAQGLILMAAKDNDPSLKQDAEKLLDFMLTQRAQNGSFPYTDPNPDNSADYGFHNAEAGIALTLYTLLLEN